MVSDRNVAKCFHFYWRLKALRARARHDSIKTRHNPSIIIIQANWTLSGRANTHVMLRQLMSGDLAGQHVGPAKQGSGRNAGHLTERTSTRLVNPKRSREDSEPKRILLGCPSNRRGPCRGQRQLSGATSGRNSIFPCHPRTGGGPV